MLLSPDDIRTMREELQAVRNIMSLQEPTHTIVVHTGEIRLEPIEEG